MRIRRLDTTSRRDVRQFVDFPFQLYRDYPHWVPPLISSVRGVLDRRKHPFYQHSTADFFIAESGGRTLGRIAVMDNRNYNEYRGSSEAFFGYFEAVENVGVARALFDACCQWAHARGLDEIRGPRALIGSDSGGVLVAGFEHRPALNVPYNPPYYDALIRDSGFEKDTDHISAYLRADHKLPERFHRIADKLKAQRGFWVKSFSTKREMREWVPRVAEVHREAFSPSYTFYPPTEDEMALIADTIVSIADPRLIKLVMKGENVIGFVLAYHDISAALQKAKGRLWPFGWYYLLRERWRTKWVNGNGIGVLPEYQGLGPSILLYTEISRAIKELGFEHVDVVQVDEKNLMSYSALDVAGVTWYKRHRSYWRAL